MQICDYDEEKKIPDQNLDTVCPAGIPCNYDPKPKDKRFKTQLYVDQQINVEINVMVYFQPGE